MSKKTEREFLKALEFAELLQYYVSSDGELWEYFLQGRMGLTFTEADGAKHSFTFPIMAELFEVFQGAARDILAVMAEDYELPQCMLELYEHRKQHNEI